ncbi:ATPase [Pseudomonas mosselii]|uniref:ATPase n=1 Tax=Pseudomonas mosselii TaxID=78327 RepID=UPI003F3AA647
MPAKIVISEAYCVELKENVSISEARRAYFSLPKPRARFTFQCSYSECLALDEPPAITGVNYANLPEETYRAAHFRDPGKGHVEGCPWQGDEPAASDEDRASDASVKDREAKRKLHDFIDEFDGTPVKPSAGPGVAVGTGTEPAGRQGQSRRGVAKGNSFANRNSTSSFVRLVEYYRNAHKDLATSEFFALRLKVVGEGEMPLVSFFPNVSKASPDQPPRVIQGGARLEPRKGRGFMLWFIGRVDGKGVYLRVTSEEMDKYRFRGFFNDTLAQEDADYFRVFGLGRLVLSDTGKSYRLDVEDLNHLTIFAVKKQQPKPEADSLTSVETDA